MSADISMIVRRLREEPFSRELSLVAFDELGPQELTELLNDVLGEVSPAQRVNLRDERPEETMPRILEFLRVLNYKPPQSTNPQAFGQGIMSGDRDIIYPILQWVLAKFPDCQKRAYLARFLVSIEVPDELFADEEIQQIYQAYKDQQDVFKQVHKQVAQLKGSVGQPGQIKERLEDLEDQKEALKVKIGRLKDKTQDADEEFFGVVKQLRKAEETKTRLHERYREQQTQLHGSQTRLKNLQTKLSELRANSESLEADQVVDQLEEEVRMNRFLLTEKIPGEIAERIEARNRSQDILSTPAVSDAEVNKLQLQVRNLTGEVNVLQRKRDAESNPADDKLGIFRQQAHVVAKKKETFQDKLNKLRTEKTRLERELAEKDQQVAGANRKMLRDEEFKRYVNSLRGKSQTYKQMKAELAEIRSEWGILNRTLEILKSRAHNAGEVLAALEKKRGVAGYGDTKDQLEKVSEQKRELDEAKGKTLEDISAVVTEINNSIKARKNKLAPQIKELRAQREKFQVLEAEHMERRSVYENVAVGLESEKNKWEGELNSLTEDCLRDESRYHYLHSLSLIADVQLNRVMAEVKSYIKGERGDGPAGRDFRSYKELYTQKIEEEEALSKTLRESQKQVKDNHETNLRQVRLFQDLSKLLQVKLQSGPGAAGDPDLMAGAGPAGDIGVDRLVL